MLSPSWLLATHDYGAGTARSLQIFLASSSLISVWRGTADVLPPAFFTKMEWLAPSLKQFAPVFLQVSN